MYMWTYEVQNSFYEIILVIITDYNVSDMSNYEKFVDDAVCHNSEKML